MKRLGTLVAVGVCLLLSVQQARAELILADARGDFVAGTSEGDPAILSATGTGEWRYVASDTSNPTLDGSLDLLWWTNTTPRYLFPTGGGSQNQVIGDHPAITSDEVLIQVSSPSPRFTVLRWTAGAGDAGMFDIAGNIRHIPVAGTGDGSTFEIFVDGVSIFSQFLIPNDSVGVGFNLSPTIGVGSTVDFVLGPNGNDSWDLPALQATISGVPEPSTLALLGIGTLGLLAYNRRRKRAA